MSDSDLRKSALEANTSFYTAFRTRNTEMMAGLWASRAPVSVIHPGWPELSGRAAVLDSWARIMAGDGSPEIHAENALVNIRDNVATVYCEEDLGGAELQAVNIFVLENGLWKMTHHRANQPSEGRQKLPA